MMLGKAKTAEQLADKQRRRDERENQQRETAAAREREEFLRTPVGQAQNAFERGDQAFQYQLDVLNQLAVIAPLLVGETKYRRTTDSVEVLNAVCAEGWELVNGSFVFVHTGVKSRDTLVANGQNSSIMGRTVGYYLFKRCEANRKAPPTTR